MGYLKKKLNPKSIANLDPHNRLLGVVPKKRINIVIDEEHYALLKQTGNISESIGKLVENDLMKTSTDELKYALTEILNKVDSKDKGFRVNACGGLLKALRDIKAKYLKE